MRSGWGMSTIHPWSCPLTIAIMTVFMCRQSASLPPRIFFSFTTSASKGPDTSSSLALPNKHHQSRLTNHKAQPQTTPNLFSSTLIAKSTSVLLAQFSRKSTPGTVKDSLKLTRSLQKNVNVQSLESRANNNHGTANKTTNNGNFFQKVQKTDNDLLVRKLHPQPLQVEAITRQTQVQQTAGCPPLNESFVLTNDSESCRTCLCDEDIVAFSLTTVGFATSTPLAENDRKDIKENPRATISTTNNNIASNNESLTEENDYQLNRSPPRCRWIPCINVTFGRNESYNNNKDAFKVGKCLIAVACVIAFLSIFGFFLSVHRFCERRGHFQLASSDEDLY